MDVAKLIYDYMNEWLESEDCNTKEAWHAVRLAVLDSVDGIEVSE